jgi:membrane peptidoglycan carboxypeptidase
MKKVIKYLTVFIFVIILCLYAATWIPLSRDVLGIYEQKSETILIKDRHGYLLREVPLQGGLKTRWVKITDISPHLIDATIYAEDKRFYSHSGFDPIAIVRASIQNPVDLR